MKAQMILDRRQHPREGLFGEMENLTYSVLRKYGIPGPGQSTAGEPPTEKAAKTGRFGVALVPCSKTSLRHAKSASFGAIDFLHFTFA